VTPTVEPRPRRRPGLLALLTVTVTLTALAAAGCGAGSGAGKSARPAPTSSILGPDPTTTDGGPTATGLQDLSPAQVRTVDELKAQVSEIRGLPWKADLPTRIVSPTELAARIRRLTVDDLTEHKQEVDATEAFLKLVGLFPADLDYVKTLDKVLSAGTLGYYDDQAKELFVGGDPGTDLGPAAKSTMVHELTHALTDQHFDFGARMRADVDAGRSEEAFSLSSLAEGDAERVRELWSAKYLTAKERRQAVENEGGGDVSAFLSAPPYLLTSLTFPYVQGLEFVTDLQQSGGFAAVDAAYRRPPTSSEEIIHPSVYAAGGQWSAPVLPDVAGAAGCQAADTGNVGEFDMTQMLGLHLDDKSAADAAAGWNGDAYALVRCGSAIALVDRWRADSPGDLDELARALAEWGKAWSGSSGPTGADGSFAGPDGAGRVIRSGDRIDLVVAADAPTADRLALALPAS
jgi:hypothetical protein